MTQILEEVIEEMESPRAHKKMLERYKEQNDAWAAKARELIAKEEAEKKGVHCLPEVAETVARWQKGGQRLRHGFKHQWKNAVYTSTCPRCDGRLRLERTWLTLAPDDTIIRIGDMPCHKMGPQGKDYDWCMFYGIIMADQVIGKCTPGCRNACCTEES